MKLLITIVPILLVLEYTTAQLEWMGEGFNQNNVQTQRRTKEAIYFYTKCDKMAQLSVFGDEKGTYDTKKAEYFDFWRCACRYAFRYLMSEANNYPLSLFYDAEKRTSFPRTDCLVDDNDINEMNSVKITEKDYVK
jgi:hypothetical protein